jgi:hypothetical protein
MLPGWVFDAAGFALILWPVFRAGGKAAGGISQRQMAVAQHFDFKLIANAQLFALGQ